MAKNKIEGNETPKKVTRRVVIIGSYWMQVTQGHCLRLGMKQVCALTPTSNILKMTNQSLNKLIKEDIKLLLQFGERQLVAIAGVMVRDPTTTLSSTSKRP